MVRIVQLEAKSEKEGINWAIWAGITACGLWTIIFLYATLNLVGAEPWNNVKDASVSVEIIDSLLYINSWVCSYIWGTRNLSIPIIGISAVTWALSGVRWNRVRTLIAVACVLLVMAATTLGMGMICAIKKWVVPSQTIIQVLSGCGATAACISMSLSGLAYSLQKGIKSNGKPTTGTKVNIINRDLRLENSIPTKQFLICYRRILQLNTEVTIYANRRN